MRQFLSIVAVVALCMGVVSFYNDARANEERITLYEINQFLDRFDRAVNHNDLSVGYQFVRSHMDEAAMFKTRLVVPAAMPQRGYGYAHHVNTDRSAYHRYPFPYAGAPYVQQVSHYDDNRHGYMVILENKKRRIPGYHQASLVEGFTMFADADEVAVDIALQEYGVRYSSHAYGLLESVPYYHSQCRMYISKQRGELSLKGLSCETLSAMSAM